VYTLNSVSVCIYASTMYVCVDFNTIQQKSVTSSIGNIEISTQKDQQNGLI